MERKRDNGWGDLGGAAQAKKVGDLFPNQGRGRPRFPGHSPRLAVR